MKSKPKSVILTISIAIVLALFIGITIETFYPTPDYNDFSERIRHFTATTDWEYSSDPGRRDGFLICADIKDNYGKELSNLVESEIKKLKIEFVENFVNGIYIFLPKLYTIDNTKKIF